MDAGADAKTGVGTLGIGEGLGSQRGILGWGQDGAERALLDAKGATAAAAGVDGGGLVAVDAQDCLETASLCGKTLAAGPAALVVNPRRDDGM